MNNHVLTFTQLNVGDHFRTSRITKPHGEGWMWCEYEKISRSGAICTAQHGYGNTRQVGGLKNFSPNSIIFKLEEEV